MIVGIVVMDTVIILRQAIIVLPIVEVLVQQRVITTAFVSLGKVLEVVLAPQTTGTVTQKANVPLPVRPGVGPIVL